MNFDDEMRNAWQRETRRGVQAKLTARVRRQRRQQYLQRLGEIGLTLLLLLVFGRALILRTAEPAHWLLLPFFAVFLPVVWIIVLRTSQQRLENVTESVDVYARLRLAQLRSRLCDLWLARKAALGLVVYSVGANVVVIWLGNPDWRKAAANLLVYAFIWATCTFWFSHRLCLRYLREYRTVRRLIGA